MADLQLTSTPDVRKVFDRYPAEIRPQMLRLRELVLETARSTDGIDRLEETLKWGEPSYLAKHGSTLRMDWKARRPDRVALYFKCTSRLVPTFRQVFPDLEYEGDRAVLLPTSGPIPEETLRSCIRAALRYHKVKQETLLGLQ